MKTTHQLLIEAITELAKYDSDKAIEIGEESIAYHEHLLKCEPITF